MSYSNIPQKNYTYSVVEQLQKLEMLYSKLWIRIDHKMQKAKKKKG